MIKACAVIGAALFWFVVYVVTAPLVMVLRTDARARREADAARAIPHPYERDEVGP